MDRMYAILEVKRLEDEQRIIRGIATTPQPDRVGDVVEPLGVQFKNPLPLLWQHRSDEPVGTVTFDSPTEDGIEFEAQLPHVKEPGTLRDRVEEAWQSIKLGLVRGVSIGFTSLETARIKATDGVRFIKTEVLELSLVTIPANEQALIQSIKSLDLATRAAPGNCAEQVGKAGVTAMTTYSFASKDAKPMATVHERKQQLEGRRGHLEGSMSDIQTKCSEEDRSKTEDERKTFDAAVLEIETIDRELADLVTLERINIAKAAPVTKIDSPQAASVARAGQHGWPIIKMHEPEIDAGIVLARMAIAKACSMFTGQNVVDVVKSRPQWANSPYLADLVTRAAVTVGTTTDSTWAGPLVVAQNFTAAFARFLRPLTIMGQIPGLLRVPANITVPRETGSVSVGWVGEAVPKPVSKGAFDSIALRWAKAAGITVVTEELARYSDPAVEALIRDQFAAAMTQFLDRQFIDPAVAEVTNVSPASITNGVTPITATGTTAAAFRTDMRTMQNQFLSANQQLGNAVLIMTQQQALALSMMVSSLSVPLFPNITKTGGSIYGFPVIASENIPFTGGSPDQGTLIIMALPSEIMVNDEGQTVIDVSREASVQMDSAPDNPTTASTVFQSLWQANMVGIRAEHWITWKKRRATAVSFIQNAKYAE